MFARKITAISAAALAGLGFVGFGATSAFAASTPGNGPESLNLTVNSSLTLALSPSTYTFPATNAGQTADSTATAVTATVSTNNAGYTLTEDWPATAFGSYPANTYGMYVDNPNASAEHVIDASMIYPYTDSAVSTPGTPSATPFGDSDTPQTVATSATASTGSGDAWDLGWTVHVPSNQPPAAYIGALNVTAIG